MPVEKLYTIREAFALLGFDGSKELTQAEFADSVQASRCYRQIGKAVRMTESDIIAYLAWASPRRERGGTPADHEIGQIVALSDPLENDGLVYVGWTHYGEELILRDTVRDACPDDVRVTGVWAASYGEYAALVEKWTVERKRYGKRGKWFLRSVNEDIKELVDEPEEALI